MPIACALAPRFRLLAALEGRRELLSRPAALAPEPGATQLIGEVSAPAERLGVRAGTRLGEALARCPELALVPADPERSERAWELVLRRLEAIGAEVESERPGEAFFEAGGLRGLWGGIEGVLRRAGAGAEPPLRLAAAPGRFCAFAAAAASRPDAEGSGRQGGSPPRVITQGLPPGGLSLPMVVPEDGARRFLSPLSVSLLSGRLAPPSRRYAPGPECAEADDLPNELERLGIGTLGRLAGLPREAVADRFGPPGLRALKLARGGDEPLRPRRPHRELAVELELPDAASGPQLERALELLVARLLAHPERRGRTLRALRLAARLAAGGGWRRRLALRSATAERERLLPALRPLLALLPGPVAVLALQAVELGPEAVEQLSLASPERRRRRRIGEAVRQARAAGGSDAVLRVLEVDPSSRVPERREVLMPFPEEPSEDDPWTRGVG